MGAQIFLRGNLGSDPKLAYTRSNEPYLQFSLYQSHWVKQGDEYVDKGGFWMDCVWFNAGATVAAQSLKKGMPVVVNGDMRLDTWIDSDGVQRQRFKVVVATLGLAFVPKSRQDAQHGHQQPTSNDATPQTAEPVQQSSTHPVAGHPNNQTVPVQQQSQKAPVPQQSSPSAPPVATPHHQTPPVQTTAPQQNPSYEPDGFDDSSMPF